MSLAQLVRFSVCTVQAGQVARWQPRQIQRLQRRRLAQLLRTAIDLSPFYARKYQRIDLSRVPFRELPPTNKRELMENFNQVVTDPRICRKEVERFLSDTDNLGHWFLGRYSVSHTSGSQGPPLLIVQDRRSLEILFATMAARGNVTGRPRLVEGCAACARVSVLPSWRRSADFILRERPSNSCARSSAPTSTCSAMPRSNPICLLG